MAGPLGVAILTVGGLLAVGVLLLVAGGITKGVTQGDNGDDGGGGGGLGAGDWMMITGGIIIALVIIGIPAFLRFSR